MTATAVRARLDERSGVIRVALLGAAFAVLIIGASSRLDVSRMTFGDGALHRYVAENLSATPAEVAPDLEGHGTALRYGRIVLPALIWLASAGRTEAMPYVQPLLMVLAAAAIAAAASRLLPGKGAVSALAPFVAVGLTTSLAGGFAEPPAVAFALWAVVLARQERWFAAAALLGLAMLTRENAAAVLIGLIVWAIVNRRARGTVVLASALVPVAVWYLAVQRRFGFLPLDDPFLRNTKDAFGPPVVAAWRSLTRSGSLATLLVAVHLVAAAVAFALWRSSDLGSIAAAGALQMLWNGPPQWQYIGDGVRLQVFLEVFVVLAVVAKLRRRDDEVVTGARPG